MTLLVLSLKPPDDGPLLPQIVRMLPKIGIYFLAFIQLGVIWIAHTFEMDFEKDASRWYSWCNLLLFMFVALLPFSVSVLGDRPLDPVSSLVYGLNMVCIEASLLIYWFLGWMRLEEGLDPRLKRKPLMRTGGALLMFALAIPLAFLDCRVSFAIFVLVPIMYILPTGGEVKQRRKG